MQENPDKFAYDAAEPEDVDIENVKRMNHGAGGFAIPEDALQKQRDRGKRSQVVELEEEDRGRVTRDEIFSTYNKRDRELYQ